MVAVGGDGTVADVATGIFGSNAALAIVPAGSTNIAARSLGIPAEPAAALALLGGSYRLRSIDIGRSGSLVHPYGWGRIRRGAVFQATSPVWKRRLGWIAYIPAAVAALRLPPSDVRVTADDAVLEARSPLVLIANGGSAIAPQFRIYPGITVDDGWLDVLVFTPSTPAQIAATLGHAGMQKLPTDLHTLRIRRARTVRIEAAPPLPSSWTATHVERRRGSSASFPEAARLVTPVPSTGWSISLEASGGMSGIRDDDVLASALLI